MPVNARGDRKKSIDLHHVFPVLRTSRVYRRPSIADVESLTPQGSRRSLVVAHGEHAVLLAASRCSAADKDAVAPVEHALELEWEASLPSHVGSVNVSDDDFGVEHPDLKQRRIWGCAAEEFRREPDNAEQDDELDALVEEEMELRYKRELERLADVEVDPECADAAEVGSHSRMRIAMGTHSKDSTVSSLAAAAAAGGELSPADSMVMDAEDDEPPPEKALARAPRALPHPRGVRTKDANSSKLDLSQRQHKERAQRLEERKARRQLWRKLQLRYVEALFLCPPHDTQHREAVDPRELLSFSGEELHELVQVYKLLHQHGELTRNGWGQCYAGILAYQTAQLSNSASDRAVGITAAMMSCLTMAKVTLAQEFYDRALQLLTPLRNRALHSQVAMGSLGWLLSRVAFMDITLARWDTVKGYLKLAYETQCATRDVFSMLETVNHLALLYRIKGEISRSTQLFLRLRSFGRRHAMASFYWRAVVGLAENFTLAGEMTSALRALADVQSVMEAFERIVSAASTAASAAPVRSSSGLRSLSGLRSTKRFFALDASKPNESDMEVVVRFQVSFPLRSPVVWATTTDRLPNAFLIWTLRVRN